MGGTKSQMKPSSTKNTDDDKDIAGGLNKLKSWRMKRKKAPKTVEEKADTFADMIIKAGDSLDGIIENKEAELNNETGREDYNRRTLTRLELMAYHLDKISELGEEINEDS